MFGFLRAVNIAVADPEVILVRSDLTPDMDELRSGLLQYIDEENMPDLIRVTDIREYACLGTMMYGLFRLRRMKEKELRKKA